MSPRIPLITGFFLAALGIVLGAFGVHYLPQQLPLWYPEPDVAARMADIWEMAVRYQMYTSLGCVALGLWLEQRPGRRGRLTLTLFVLGSLLFSGLLYLLVCTGVRVLGAIVPLGGLALIAGWLSWGLALWQESPQQAAN
jgi:uncharacterized membrane protein YgdD (TMEM256/DUF423 family)